MKKNKKIVSTTKEKYLQAMEGYLPPTWKLQLLNHYGKDGIYTTFVNKFGNVYPSPIRPDKLTNTGDEVKVRITVEEI